MDDRPALTAVQRLRVYASAGFSATVPPAVLLDVARAFDALQARTAAASAAARAAEARAYRMERHAMATALGALWMAETIKLLF